MFRKINHWLRFNLRYLGKPPWDTGVSPPELIKFLGSLEPGRALDLGSGTGTNLLTMAEYGWGVVGVDLAWLSVLKARLKLQDAGQESEVILGDVTDDLGLQERFDLVLDIGCYHSLTESGREDYRHNLRHWTKQGGTYLLYAHRRTSPDASHGIFEDDLEKFETFLTLQWREDSDENRPDGGGGYPATWVQFVRGKDLSTGPSFSS